jgi:hypothetical protein
VLLARRKNRRRGRLKIDLEFIQITQRMCWANPHSGTHRIHGQLLERGIEISETTAAK